MIDFQANRFFTPPTDKGPLLGLDLKELTGGGACPSQYEGFTHDGLHVYCRYRGGMLSVSLASKPGAMAHKDGETIYKQHLGPPLDGYVSLAQVCHFAGLTINGELPALGVDDPTEGREKDLSGATSYYYASVDSTLGSAEKFLKVLCESDTVMVLQHDIDSHYRSLAPRICRSLTDLTETDVTVIFEQFPDKLFSEGTEELIRECLDGLLKIRIHFPGFKYPMRPYANQTASTLKTMFDLECEIAGQVDDCVHTHLTMDASYATDNPEQVGRVRWVNGLLDRFFPIRTVPCMKLISGEPVPDRDWLIASDPEIDHWIAAGEMRWRFVDILGLKTGDDVIGWRPR